MLGASGQHQGSFLGPCWGTKCSKMRYQKTTKKCLAFGSNFGRFWVPRGEPWDPRGGSWESLFLLKIIKIAPGRSRGVPEGVFWSIWGRFWIIFWTIFVDCWVFVCLMFDALLVGFRQILIDMRSIL